jgi:orotate phosphoribosyltransferase-like protein
LIGNVLSEENFVNLDMKHFVVVDDETPDGEELIRRMKQLSKETVEFIDDQETIEDCVTVEQWGDMLRNQLKQAYDTNHKA